jgi:hypothetical protein
MTQYIPFVPIHFLAPEFTEEGSRYCHSPAPTSLVRCLCPCQALCEGYPRLVEHVAVGSRTCDPDLVRVRMLCDGL